MLLLYNDHVLVLRPCGFNNRKWLEVLLPVGAKKKGEVGVIQVSPTSHQAACDCAPPSLWPASPLLQVGSLLVPEAVTLKKKKLKP